MIVFDVFIDIESTNEFSDLNFQIFMISIEKSVLVMIEDPVNSKYQNHSVNLQF